MGLVQIEGFSGIVPVSGDRALGNNFATKSVNTWLYGGELRGLRPPLQLIDVTSTTEKVLRIPKRTVGGDPAFPGVVPPPSYLGDSLWSLFLDDDTDILKGQLVEDSFERYYFCSPSTGPMFNTYARMLAGLSAWKLGVPGPETAVGGPNSPTISSITGGSPPTLTRAFLYTWVNDYGEESSPSLPVIGAGNADGTWNIAGIDDPIAVAGYAPYNKKYLYRTITGTSGQTTYYRVATIALGTTTYADNGATMTDAILAGNLTLESTSWAMPPATLKGFAAMPNGFLIGWDGNNVYFSESYHWHAWPAAYKQATETPVVGIGVLGQTAVVCTQGFPVTITGAKPGTVSFTKADTSEPCLSRGSIVSTPAGVLYAGPNGLTMVGPSGIQNVTQQIITKEKWTTDYSPQFLRAVRYGTGYLGMRQIPGGTNSAFFLDPTDLKVALTELSDFSGVKSVQTDFWSGEVFTISTGGSIKRWDAPSAEMMPVQWRSKEFQYPFEENFGCYALWWDESRYSAYNYGTGIMPTTEHVRLKVYADRVLVYNQLVPRNGKPVRLPSGFKKAVWQFEILARAPVYRLQVASTMKELKQA